MDYAKIKSYEDACADQGRDPNNKPDVSKLEPGLAKFIMAAFMLAVINRSLNKDENGKLQKADWTGEEWNHYPWWRVKGATEENPSGSGLSLFDVDFGDSIANVASRLTNREEDAARYSAETFPELWKDLILDTED